MTYRDTSKVCIDNGSGTIKVGWGGNDVPRYQNPHFTILLTIIIISESVDDISALFPTIVGKPDTSKLFKYMMSSSSLSYYQPHRNESYVGDEALHKRGILKFYYPFPKDRKPVLWDLVPRIWNYAVFCEIGTTPDDHPLIMTSLHLMDDEAFTKMSEIAFEKMRVPAFYIIDPAVSSMIGMGRTIGTVLESGYGMTKSLSVYGGYPINSSLTRMEFPTHSPFFEKRLSGSSVTDYLVEILEERGYEMTTPSERDIVNKLKEKLCFVSLDYEKDVNKSIMFAKYEEEYELPDGSKMTVGSERYRAPEILFRPCLSPLFTRMKPQGVHQLVHSSIQKCSVELHRELYGSIILSGGNTLFENFDLRISEELRKLTVKENYRISVSHQFYDRKFSPWIGISILSQMSSFDEEWVGRDMYDEHGSARIMKIKCQRVVWESGEIEKTKRLRGRYEYSYQSIMDGKERLEFVMDLHAGGSGKKLRCTDVEFEIRGIFFLMM